MSWSEVLHCRVTMVPVSPMVARRSAASQKSRVTASARSPAHATASASRDHPAGGWRCADRAQGEAGEDRSHAQRRHQEAEALRAQAEHVPREQGHVHGEVEHAEAHDQLQAEDEPGRRRACRVGDTLREVPHDRGGACARRGPARGKRLSAMMEIRKARAFSMKPREESTRAMSTPATAGRRCGPC